ncbi:MAG: BspA family leucine-rich repeat surface protein, partial [Clostridia bacterium]|nr:BspA family leucine-rich repeat surface protein [Clostridia bacterium]
TETTDCGGFIGRAESCTVTISNSMMAAGAFEPSGSQNFVNGSASPTLTSCYYRAVTADDASQGTRAYVVSGDSLRLSRVSGGGFGWDSLLVSDFSGKLFGAAGDQIVFTSSLGQEPLYCADAPLTRNGSRFTITLPAQDTTIKDAQKVWFSITRATGLAGGTVITNYYDGTWPGNVVTVSAIPNKAYVFGSVTVADSHGNELTLTPNEDGDFTFIMPGDAVNVTASFLKKYEYNTTTRELRLLRGTFSDDRDDRWISNDFQKDLVLSVTAEPGVRFTGDCSQLFYGFFECTSFDLSNVDTAGLTSAAQMFLECEDLTTLNLTGWDVSALTDISQMFQGCTSLTSVSFNGWQDAPISDAGDLLKGCTALSSADLSGLRLIGAVTDGMFSGAGALSEVRVPGGLHITEEMQLNNNGLGWVQAGTDILLCHGDEYGTLKGYGDEGTVYRWATVELGPRYTLENGILSLNWGDFSISSKWGNDVDGNKAGITAVTAKDGVSFIGDCTGLFSGFYNCLSMDLNKADTTKMTNMSSMFANCTKLSTLNVSDWITVNVTDMSNAFLYCEGLDLPDLSGWNTANVTNMFGMFSYCSGLTGLDISGWNTAKVNSMGDMFLACTSLEQLNLSRWNTSTVTDMERMFYLCSSLKSLDLSGFDTRAIDTPVEGIYPPQSAVSGMFSGAAMLRQLKISPNMAVTAEMQLNAGNPVSAGWVVNGGQTVVSGDGEYAVIAAPSEITTFVWAAEPVPEFKKQSAGLKGQIEVNFFMDLDCLTAAQKAASYTDFTVSGKNGRTERVGFDPGNMNTGGEYYGFTFPVNSVQMADRITAVFHYTDDDGNGSTVTKEYSVEEYLGYFIDLATSNPGTYSDELIDLVKAINDYGYYAQRYLSVHAVTPWTLEADHKDMTTVYTDSYTYTLSDLSPYAIQKELRSDISAVSYSLTLDSDTAINLFISPISGYTGDIAVTVDGNAVAPVMTGGRYKIVIPGINSLNLAHMHRVVITTAAGESTVDVSVLSYAYAAYAASVEISDNNAETIKDPVTRNAMCALYDYYLKSDAYSKSLNQQNNSGN